MTWRPLYLTGAQLRAWMRVASSSEDALYADAAEAASRAVDRSCNRQFGSAGPLTRTYTPWWNPRRCCWMLTVDDFQSATGLAVVVKNGTIDPTYLKAEPPNAVADGKAYFVLSVDPASPVQPQGAENEAAVTLTTWGWASVPNAVVEATRVQGSRFAKRRDSPYGVAGSPEAGNELRLLANLDPDLKPMLSFYRRPRRPF